MRSLEHRTGIDFHQGLRCVQYRMPRPEALGETGFVLCLGLRYGLIGVSAVKHLVVTSSPTETARVLDSALSWPKVAASHFHEALVPRLGCRWGSGAPFFIADLADETMRAGLPLIKRACTLEDCIDAVATSFVKRHLGDVAAWWNPVAKLRSRRAFLAEARRSALHAKFFFERRQCDLPEVPEIALLGE